MTVFANTRSLATLSTASGYYTGTLHLTTRKPRLVCVNIYHWRELPQVSFLSRQNFCRDKDVFACRDITFVLKYLHSMPQRCTSTQYSSDVPSTQCPSDVLPLNIPVMYCHSIPQRCTSILQRCTSTQYPGDVPPRNIPAMYFHSKPQWCTSCNTPVMYLHSVPIDVPPLNTPAMYLHGIPQ